MSESLCEVVGCDGGTVYNFCGACGLATCTGHSVPVPDTAYEEGYVCPTCIHSDPVTAKVSASYKEAS